MIVVSVVVAEVVVLVGEVRWGEVASSLSVRWRRQPSRYGVSNGADYRLRQEQH